ncbi:discoidin domain-containing protein [Dickeya chrysanthemi]|uniref:Discoidin domain-containing protein n=1 Tax=Dickeya chrysanthemi TaxID=556 RepID=A0ABU8JRS4_DICCH
MWYKSGGLSLFSGSKVVLGENTLWADKNNGVIAGGMLLIFTDCGVRIYEIASVVSDTELVLASEYGGCTENHVRYAIPVLGSNDTFDHAAYVAQIAAMLAGYQSQLAQWKQVLIEHGQVTLTDNNGQSVVVKTLPDLTDAVSRMMDKTLNGADIPDKAQFVANLGLGDVVHQSDLANHTHTAAQITDFTDAVRKVLVSTLAAGQGVALNYDAGSNQLVVSATGGNSGGGNSSGNSGGRGYTVVTRNGMTANQVFTFPFSVTGTMDYSFDAYALKEEAGSTSTIMTDSYDSGDVYNHTPGLLFDGTAKAVAGEKVALSSDGAFFSTSLSPRPTATAVSIYARSNRSALPAMTGNTQGGYIVTASSNNADGNAASQLWKAFNKSNAVLTDAWLSAGAPSSASPQWIAIQMPAAVRVAGYSIATRNQNGYSNSPKTWIFQGSNNGTTWVDLHSVVGDTRNVAGQVRAYSLRAQADYAYYRLYITDYNIGNLAGFVAVGELDIQLAEKILLRSGSNYYTSSDGALVQIASPSTAVDIDSVGFYWSGYIPISSLMSLGSVSIVTGRSADAIILYPPQIAIPLKLSNIKGFNAITLATATVNQTGVGFVRVAVSRNLTEWFVFSDSAWVSIGTLTANDTDASKLMAQGMTPAMLAGITASQWSLLYTDTLSMPDNIAFAVAIDAQNPENDSAAIDSISLSVSASAWKLQSSAEVEIRWYPDKVTFKTVAAGNYKLAYQQP